MLHADAFQILCVARQLPMPEREFRFHPTRRWRFDWAFPDVQIAVEQEGGIWAQGRHTRGKGFEADCEKYAEAILLGWRVFRASVEQIEDGTAVDWIVRARNTPQGERTP